MAVFNQCVEAPCASKDKAGIELTDPNKVNKKQTKEIKKKK